MDRGVWWATVHGVTVSQTVLSDLHFHFHGRDITDVLCGHTSVTNLKQPL